ncbi:MAG: indole-3-glycerol phosphate synthase TrpC [Actinobacteria bacterium]|nr:MAG: indole-3-glycerol phosphate synthase TrpC [Actinomycetota bacterium]
MSILERIVEETREEVAARRERVPASALESELDASASGASGGEGRFEAALRAPGMSVIAEHKRRSPSAGTLRDGADLSEIVAGYERGGAAALSVLTEERHFAGSLDDLRAARTATGLPLLRKDFIVDPYQLLESAAAGADAVLLIVAALDFETLGELQARARELGLEALVEVHDARELELAGRAGARIIGINNRDLRDFTVDVERTLALLDQVPAGATVVSESGIEGAQRIRELRDAGVHAVLIGERLMRAPDPEAELRSLLA